MALDKQQEYFDLSQKAKPLLHALSPIIEEQFYLMFPVLPMLLSLCT